jgi:hypothetical protein
MTYTPPPTPGSDLPAGGEPPAPRRRLGCALEIVETLVMTLVIYLVIHNFVAQPFEVEQSSMVPTVNPGEYVLIDKISPRFNDYQRGTSSYSAAVGFEGWVRFIKRVIGMPGRRQPRERSGIRSATGGSRWASTAYVVRSIGGGRSDAAQGCRGRAPGPSRRAAIS